MNRLFPQLAQRLFNTPLALHPRKAEVALAALAERLGIAQVVTGRPMALDDDELLGFGEPARDARGYDIACGVACLQVEGMLVQKTGTLRPYSGMTGYDGLRLGFLSALADPAARAIVLDMNSGGGEVSGMFELAETIYQARGTKPVWAICGDHAYSAAYALASAADRILVPRLGGTGSIGVLVMLVDYSRAITASGLAVHFVHYGAAKAELTRQMHQGIEPAMLERIGRDVAVMGDVFVETVARNRRLSVAAVRAQEAEYYLGADGVRAGLADAVASPDEAFEQLLDTLA